LHFILSVSHPAYGSATSLSHLTQNWQGPTVANPAFEDSRTVPDSYHWSEDKVAPAARRANATIVMLARNSDIKGVLRSIKQMEDRFNRRFLYPYTFLNEEPFSDQFKESVANLLLDEGEVNNARAGRSRS
jgi:alpha 1,2-mannosyltransferase